MYKIYFVDNTEDEESIVSVGLVSSEWEFDCFPTIKNFLKNFGFVEAFLVMSKDEEDDTKTFVDIIGLEDRFFLIEELTN